MESFLISLFTVSIAELGDKTQILAFLLATRFRKPWVVIAGILIATIFSHLIAALVGEWLGDQLSGIYLHIILGTSFILTAIWALIPDKLDKEEESIKYSSSVFITVVVAFFLAEIGDKTQIATAILAARFDNIIWVVMGTTLGMMMANVPAIFLGQKLIKFIPLKLIRFLSAFVFTILGGIEFTSLT